MGYGLGKFEARITVPTSGYRMQVTDSGGGPVTVTVLAAGNYYPNSTAAALAAIAAALTADPTLAGTYTVTSDDGATTSTGKTTISCAGGGNPTIAWPDTALRDFLGFTATLSGAASYLSPSACKNIWLPDVKRANPIVPDGHIGMPMSDGTCTVAPSGKSKILKFGDRNTNSLELAMVSGQKTWTQFEVTPNESYESFWKATIALGLPLRYHPDRSNDATFADERVINISSMAARPEHAGFVGGPGADGASLRFHIGPVPTLRFI